jgi:hypothetical protein
MKLAAIRAPGQDAVQKSLTVFLLRIGWLAAFQYYGKMADK